MFKINVQLPFILFLTVQDFFSQSLHDDLRSGGHFCCSCFPSLIRWPSLWNLLQVATYLCLVLSSRDTWIFSNALDLNFEEWLRLCLSPADVRECASNPCQNGGTCVEGVNHYRCTCPQSWSGSHCQHQTQTGQCCWAGLCFDIFYSQTFFSCLLLFSKCSTARVERHEWPGVQPETSLCPGEPSPALQLRCWLPHEWHLRQQHLSGWDVIAH